MKRAALIALALACIGLAQAQPAPCPAAADVDQPQLLGLWRAQLDAPAAAATLLLEPHPEYAQSVRGTVNRNGEQAQLAGDVDGGEFTLEESADGRRISAIWLGDVVEGSCGREIRGTWQAEGAAVARPFVLRKLD
jgi:hypothetical protein